MIQPNLLKMSAQKVSLVEIYNMGIIGKSCKAIFAAFSAVLLVSLGTAILIFGAPIMSVLLIIGGCTAGAVVIAHGIYSHLTRK